MLAVHWSPVKNTKRILKNGISKSENGLYCFPLTGQKSVDQWWVINRWKYRKPSRYDGFIFKIEREDMPAYFGHGYGHTNQDTFKMEINDLEELELLYYKKRIMNIIGENWLKHDFSKTKEIVEIARKLIKAAPFRYKPYMLFFNDPDPLLLESSFSEWLESQSIDREEPVNELFLEIAKAEMNNNAALYNEALNDVELLNRAFSDWQIILSDLSVRTE